MKRYGWLERVSGVSEAGMFSRTKSDTDAFPTGSTHDETCAEILDRLDELKGLALETGDHELVDGLSHVFETFITRYCDSRHAALNTRIRRHFQPPKAYMN